MPAHSAACVTMRHNPIRRCYRLRNVRNRGLAPRRPSSSTRRDPLPYRDSLGTVPGRARDRTLPRADRRARPGAAVQGSAAPPGLRAHFMFGLAAQPTDGQVGPTFDNITWLKNSGTPWDACYQYLAGGVNTGNGWANWNTGRLLRHEVPGGGGCRRLRSGSYLLPAPAVQPALRAAARAEQDFNNLNNTATMAAYYADFKLLMQKCGALRQAVHRPRGAGHVGLPAERLCRRQRRRGQRARGRRLQRLRGGGRAAKHGGRLRALPGEAARHLRAQRLARPSRQRLGDRGGPGLRHPSEHRRRGARPPGRQLPQQPGAGMGSLLLRSPGPGRRLLRVRLRRRRRPLVERE